VKAALLALALLVPTAASAADLPPQFLGTWRIANPTDSQCRKPEMDGAPEGHIVVKPGAIEQSWCRVISVRPTRKDVNREPVSVAVRLDCSGEGMRWRDRTLWHLETVDGKRLIALTTLSSAVHDLRGRRMQDRTVPVTAIYTECR
jgi:hypothetical protein